jgi:ubiquinone/menaquinone biosynthesis C-methylase UbiE
MTVPPVLLKGDEFFANHRPDDQYDNHRELSRYLLMHYGQVEDVFDRLSHPLAAAHGYPRRLSDLLRSAARRSGTRVAWALDVGCGVGGVSHALSSWVEDTVVGLDASVRSIEIAQSVTLHGGGTFSVAEEGPFFKDVEVRIPDRSRQARLQFELGDASRLRTDRPAFDAVVLSNVLDRVDDPVACLEQFSGSDRILRDGGLLMVACPWSWYPEFTPPAAWLGSARDNTTSGRALKQTLQRDFTLLAESDEPVVLRQNPREFDYFEAHVTVWGKNGPGRPEGAR